MGGFGKQNLWYIGDATAAFYNYICQLVAGFTEYDTFRGSQIREGDIKREKVLVYGARRSGSQSSDGVEGAVVD
jgi:hypothetical protein